VAGVAGALEYPRYNLFDRRIIQFITRITGGPTDPADPTEFTEFTDWDLVAAVADNFAATVLP
jgi:menaquinone-dependent protoporphyrinogen IX oxidase